VEKKSLDVTSAEVYQSSINAQNARGQGLKMFFITFSWTLEQGA